MCDLVSHMLQGLLETEGKSPPLLKNFEVYDAGVGEEMQPFCLFSGAFAMHSELTSGVPFLM